ncbi:MAG TPA: dihydrolipoyl dehydrogenase [Thermodesulfobacteriota bacterium]|nr:dihydrolipoyl dehydrogenase [Thermodesulfobacteriota bacterium]
MDEKSNSTQLAVIGGGPGGYPAAFLAADLGMDVTLIDLEPNPGGVCLYRGCIPSKALLHVAKVISEARHASNWGIEFSQPVIDIDRLREWKEGVVKRLTDGLGQLSRQRKVRYIRGRATFLNPKTLKVQNQDGEELLRFKHAIIATGSRPATLPDLTIESPRILDSTSALDLPDIPKTMLVIGGGYIGLELGTVYAALGTRVTVVEMTPGLMPGVDRDLVYVLSRRLERVFDSIMLSTRVVWMEEEKNGIRVRFEGAGGKEAERMFEKVLVSVGRKPNSDGLGLENAGVRVDQNGFIEVDIKRRTSEPAIFALGDVAGEPMLAHKATHEGRVAAKAIAGHKVAFEPQAIPAVVFTDPEIAWCGLTETEAKEKNLPVKIARFSWGASGRATTLDRNDGVTKLLIDPETERILGIGIVGTGAGELIAEGVLAVEMAALASDLELTIHPHPTLSETVMEAAEVFFGTSTHLYRPKRD